VAGRRVGIFGGTFDPVHVGHLIVAEEARVRLGLERVVFVPARISPHKLDDEPAPREHRYRMVCEAVADNPLFAVSAIEIEREGPSFTVDTLLHLRRELAPDADLYFIMGMDSLESFPRWRDPQRILQLCRLVVVSRPGCAVQLDEMERVVPGLTERTEVLDMLEVGISSTELRARVRAGLPIRYQVPGAVERYIAEHGLYAPQEPGEGRRESAP
jgi:nicotinate-nucleotide adenylyltransferase